MKFVSCAGRDACTEGGTHCRGCGRSFEEITQVRDVTNAVADHALRMGYENVEEFLDYVVQKSRKKIASAREP